MDKILVVIGYTDFKYYCRPLFPKIYNDLTYKQKDLFFVTPENYAGLTDFASGDIICGKIRERGIVEAKKRGSDWVFFMDIDAIPDDDILETLLAVNHPIVGGTIACRGDSTKIIGHFYDNHQNKNRLPLNFVGKSGSHIVDGISGALMLVHKSIFLKCNYSGYDGVETIKGRRTCDDEFYCIQVEQNTKKLPMLCLDARAWHLHSDGFGYRWYGDKKPFKRTHDELIFDGITYNGR
jgi:GT2 family glycosyltransferase